MKIKKAAIKKRKSAPRIKKSLKRVPKVKAVKKTLNIKNRPIKQIIGSQETLIGQAKFYTPSPSPAPKITRQDLPLGYGQDLIILQVRDPIWLYAYWEVTFATWEKLKTKLGNNFFSAKKVLRVYDVTNINFNGKNAHRFFDIEIGIDTVNWYINTAGPGRSWCVDLGLRLENGEFILIVRSNVVQTPLDGPSWITDEEWMIPDDLFARLYGMGFGLGQSSPVGKAWEERVKKALFSGVLASPGMASMTSPSKPKEKKFWFILDCELIVYGATESDAKVTIQGKQIKLRPDGTFTLRFSLPDGKQVIDAKAESKDGSEEKIITPVVTRETKVNNFIKERIV